LSLYKQHVQVLTHASLLPHLTRLQRGIEKEGLRCNEYGELSQSPHPISLGSALTHPSITTDYSESLLEFITPVLSNAKDTIDYLQTLHKFTYKNLNNEFIWPSSMPCKLPDEEHIPIAHYGHSNTGQLKHVYRHGLWHRYGRKMQTIAGIHYNFSISEDLWKVLQTTEKSSLTPQEFQSQKYFSLIRNFKRYSWLLSYLFGASPVVEPSFLDKTKHPLKKIGNHSLYLPYATSLRMSDLGYQNNEQSKFNICYNSMDYYIETLTTAMNTENDSYQSIGLKDDHGNFKQLNTNTLQIENEYYSDIRPKRTAKHNEKPLQALKKYGIEYIEVRCTDINPYYDVGINQDHIRFLDSFLLYCLLNDSPSVDNVECLNIKKNHQKTVMEGRDPNLMLIKNEQPILLKQWAREIISDMQPIVLLLDQAHKDQKHQSSLDLQKDKIEDSALTPSAKILSELLQKNISFSEFSLLHAKQHAKSFMQHLDPQVHEEMNEEVRNSWKKQRALEDESEQSNIEFKDFLTQYLSHK
jgi:glutamate--cysteine ligase